jgi:hypothetical protein
MATKFLADAKKKKADEFYTRIYDIETELYHYREYFKGKVVLCNCDDPYESNFFKYFATNFNSLGLKKIIATCYAGSPIANQQLSLFDDETPQDKTTRNPHKIQIVEIPDINNDGAVDLTDVKLLLESDRNHLAKLQGDGDFKSDECVELLKEADIVVTNPPFSLFRDFVSLIARSFGDFFRLRSHYANYSQNCAFFWNGNRGICDFGALFYCVGEYFGRYFRVTDFAEYRHHTF